MEEKEKEVRQEAEEKAEKIVKEGEKEAEKIKRSTEKNLSDAIEHVLEEIMEV